MSVTGEDSYAVRGSDAGDQTLNLLEGARVGRVNLGEDVDGLDHDVVNVFAARRPHSATYLFEGAEQINLLGPARAAVRSSTGDTVAVIDPTGSSATRITLGATTGRIHRQVFQRLASVRGKSANQGAWGSFLGGYTKRGGDGLAQAWKHDFYGGVGGFDTRLRGGHRVGVFAGGGRGQIRTSAASVRDGASRAFFGAYGQQALAAHARGKLTLDGSVLFGYARHDSMRRVLDNLTGYETANGDYNSFYISPSLALTYVQALGSGFELRPGAQIAYTYGHFGAHTENGTTTSDISFRGRGVNIVDGRMQLALARTFADDRGEIEWRGGATLAQYSNSNAGARLGGGPTTSYRVPGDDVIHGGYTGVRLHYAINDYTTVGGDFEYVRRSGREDSVLGYLRYAVQF